MTNPTGGTKAWLHFLLTNNAASENEIAESLSQVGVSTYEINLDAPPGPGILVFDVVDSRVCRFLREASRNGLERLLAVAVSGSLLSGGQVWQLLQAGASDVLPWDRSVDPANQIAERLKRWEAVDGLVFSPVVQNNLVGQSPVWISVLRQIVEVAHFTDASVLITGETGTGKELVAGLIHSLDSQRDARDLVIVDCTTIVPGLSGSEFFGHERGAFTGAVARREGAFALANGGTLFLDEVTELSLALQAELMRVLQEHTYKRVGGNTWQQTDFRLVCATNKNLQQEVALGHVRRDFYYRIAGWNCKPPPLRERIDDVLILEHHFMKLLRRDEEPPDLDEPVQEYLLHRDYPGNVRDLKQLVSRISHRHVGPGCITVGDIPEEERPSQEYKVMDWRDSNFEASINRAVSLGVGLKEIGREAEEAAIRIAVGGEKGNLRRAARRLGVSERALQMRRATRRRNKQV